MGNINIKSKNYHILIKFITFSVVIAFLYQNAIWAGCIDLVNTERAFDKLDRNLAKTGMVGDLLPKPSRRDVAANAGAKIKELKEILKRVKKRLEEEERSESKDEGEPESRSLEEKLNTFFPEERSQQILSIKNSDSTEIPLDVDDKFIHSQAIEVSQCMDELAANAIDAVVSKYCEEKGITKKTIGRWGMGVLQVFGELIGEDELIVLESRKKNEDSVNTYVFYRKGGKIVYKKEISNISDYAGKFSCGTSFTVIKNLEKEEVLNRKQRLRDGFGINTDTKIYISSDQDPESEDKEQLNNVTGCDYINCEKFKEINEKVDSIFIRLHDYGYSIRDTGSGMTDDEIEGKVLEPRAGDKEITPEDREERRKQTGLFSRGKAESGKQGLLYHRLNGRLIGKPIPIEGADVPSEIHFIFPHSARVGPDWKELMMDEDAAIPAFFDLCDKLTGFEGEQREIKDRYARLQGLVCLIDAYQPRELRKDLPNKINLMEYLKGRIQKLINWEKKRGALVLPNIPGWEDIALPEDSDKRIIFVSPEIYDFSDSGFSWMDKVSSPDLKKIDIEVEAKIFLADFKEDKKQILLKISTESGYCAVIDKSVWNKNKESTVLKELITATLPKKSHIGGKKLQPFAKEIKDQPLPPSPDKSKIFSLKNISMVLVALVLAITISFGAFFGLVKNKHSTNVDDINFSFQIGHEYTPPVRDTDNTDDSKAVYDKPYEIISVIDTGDEEGDEDNLLLCGFYGLGPDGNPRLDRDAEFVPKGPKKDTQENKIELEVRSGDMVELLIGENGIVDPKSIIIEDESGKRREVEEKHILYGKYLKIPRGVKGLVKIYYKGDIYEEVDLINLDVFELSEQERADAEYFFRPHLETELSVSDLDQASQKTDNEKDEAMQRIMHDLLVFDSHGNYKWNGKSWSSLAYNRFTKDLEKMGVVCNGAVVYYYIMAKLLDMEVVMVRAESLGDDHKLLSNEAGHVVIYAEIDGTWQKRETTTFIDTVNASPSYSDASSRFKHMSGTRFEGGGWGSAIAIFISKISFYVFCLALLILPLLGCVKWLTIRDASSEKKKGIVSKSKKGFRPEIGNSEDKSSRGNILGESRKIITVKPGEDKQLEDHRLLLYDLNYLGSDGNLELIDRSRNKEIDFGPAFKMADYQDIELNVNVEGGDYVALLTAVRGAVHKESVVVKCEDGREVNIGKYASRKGYVQIPHDISGNVTISYKVQIFKEMNIKGYRSLPVIEDQDAEEFFGPMLCKELGVRSPYPEAGQDKSDEEKEKAIGKVMAELFCYDIFDEYEWNGRSWTSLARNKTQDGKKKMGVDYNGSAVYYYIMAKLLRMDVVMARVQPVRRDFTVRSETLSQMTVYVKINRKWEIINPNKFITRNPSNIITPIFRFFYRMLFKTSDETDIKTGKIEKDERLIMFSKVSGGQDKSYYINGEMHSESSKDVSDQEDKERISILSEEVHQGGEQFIVRFAGWEDVKDGDDPNIIVTNLHTKKTTELRVESNAQRGFRIIQTKEHFFMVHMGYPDYLSGDIYVWKNGEIKRLTEGREIKGAVGLSAIIVKEEGGSSLYIYDKGDLVKQEIDIEAYEELYYFGEDLIIEKGSCSSIIYHKRTEDNKWVKLEEAACHELFEGLSENQRVQRISTEVISKEGVKARVLDIVVPNNPNDNKRMLQIYINGKWHILEESRNINILTHESDVIIDGDILLWNSGISHMMFSVSSMEKIYNFPIKVNEVFIYEEEIYCKKVTRKGNKYYKLVEGKDGTYGRVELSEGLMPGEVWGEISFILTYDGDLFLHGVAIDEHGNKREVLLRNFREYHFENPDVDVEANNEKREKFRPLIDKLIEHNREWYEPLLERQLRTYKKWSPVYLFTAYLVDRHDIDLRMLGYLEGYLTGIQNGKVNDSVEDIERFMLLVSLLIKYSGYKKGEIFTVKGQDIIAQLSLWKLDNPSFVDRMINELLKKVEIDGKTEYAIKGIKNEYFYSQLPEESQMFVGILEGREEWILDKGEDDSKIEGEEVKEHELSSDPQRGLEEAIYVGRIEKEKIIDLGTLKQRLSKMPGLDDLFGEDIPLLDELEDELKKIADNNKDLRSKAAKEYLIILKSMLGSVEAQDFKELLFIRELVQNGRDEMKKKKIEGKIELRSYLNNNRWIFSVSDPCGMDMERIVKKLFPPDATTKGEEDGGQEDTGADVSDDELERIVAGAFGWGFYTIFADCSEVCIKTILNGNGYKIRLRPRYSKKDEEGNKRITGITLLEAKEYKVDDKERGTVIQRIKYLEEYEDDSDPNINKYDMFSVTLEHGMARRLAKKYVGGVSNEGEDNDINIIWSDSNTEDIDLSDTRKKLSEVTWSKGKNKRHIRLMTSEQGIGRVTVDGLYIQELDEELLGGIPYKWIKNLIFKDKLNLEFDVNTDITFTRKGIKEPKQYQNEIRDLVYGWIIKEYIKGGIYIPGLPSHVEFTSNPLTPYPVGLIDLLEFEYEADKSLLSSRDKNCFDGIPKWLLDRKDDEDIRSTFGKYADTKAIENANEETKSTVYRNELIRAVVVGVMRYEIILSSTDTKRIDKLKEAKSDLDAIVNRNYSSIDMEKFSNNDTFLKLLLAACESIDEEEEQVAFYEEYGISLQTGEYDALGALRDVLVELYGTILGEEEIDRIIDLEWDFKKDLSLLSQFEAFIDNEDNLDQLVMYLVDRMSQSNKTMRVRYLGNVLRAGNLWENIRTDIHTKYDIAQLKRSIRKLRGIIQTEAEDEKIKSITWSTSIQREDYCRDKLPDVEAFDEDTEDKLAEYLRENGGSIRLDRLRSWYVASITENAFASVRREHGQWLTDAFLAHSGIEAGIVADIPPEAISRDHDPTEGIGSSV